MILSDNSRYLKEPDLATLVNDLIDSQLLRSSDRDHACFTLPSEGTHPLEHLAALKLPCASDPSQSVGIDTLSRWLAEKTGIPFYIIDPLNINTVEVTQFMSHGYAKRHAILAVEIHTDHVVIASAQPWDNSWEENIRHISRKAIKRVIANPEDIRRYTEELYQLSDSVEGALGSQQNNTFGVSNFEQLLELGNSELPDANDQYIIQIVDWVFKYAFEQRASDIHIEPGREYSHLRLRIDGVLHLIYDLPQAVTAAVISRIKIQGRMNLAEKRKPQDGRLKTQTPEGDETELRLSTMPTAFGEKLVVRIFDTEVLVKSLSELGFSGNTEAVWRKLTAKPHGIVLVTGPTGSGKTITLYSTLKLLATPKVNVCTLEDPIEMIEPSFNQTPVQSSIDLNFANGLRALLRQDPDIIMVGEIRDSETAEMAIQAALTGHLVLSTMHTNDAPSAIIRMVELGIPPYLIKSSMLGVLAQRLVRTLCANCKQQATINSDRWQRFVRPFPIVMPNQLFSATGCNNCRGTGYKGRTGIYELMPFNGKIPAMLTANICSEQLRQQAIKQGMETLRLSGTSKVATGMTTIDEVLRVTSDQQDN
ncbi:MAG: GspE/PulE family protein [Endozoicomonas sp. (ex Botrylloides leachii)]|nr:GspE/PulE family protein [Endozoicomonas sp. (ex Botrylloides leachii)]